MRERTRFESELSGLGLARESVDLPVPRSRTEVVAYDPVGEGEAEGIGGEDPEVEEPEREVSGSTAYDRKLDEALRKLKPKKFAPPHRSDGLFDAENWVVRDDPVPWGGRRRKMLVLKPGKTPSRALKAIVDKSSTKWSMDCAYFVQVAHLYAQSQSSPANFDRLWTGKPFWLRYHESSGAGRKQIKYFFRRVTKAAPWKARYGGKWNAVSSKWNSGTILRAMPRGSRVMWTNELGRGDWVNENTIKVGEDRYRAFGFPTRKLLTGRQIALLLAAAVRSDPFEPIIEDAANASAALRAYTNAHVFLKEALSFRR